MALGDCFPAELINTTNLKILRHTFSDDYSDETTTTAITIGENLEAIVVPVRLAFTREVDAEATTRLADVILRPDKAPANIAIKDFVQWTDFYGTITDAEVQEIERVSGVDGLESIVLKVGRRSV